jgi:hypothetical protein
MPTTPRSAVSGNGQTHSEQSLMSRNHCGCIRQPTHQHTRQPSQNRQKKNKGIRCHQYPLMPPNGHRSIFQSCKSITMSPAIDYTAQSASASPSHHYVPAVIKHFHVTACILSNASPKAEPLPRQRKGARRYDTKGRGSGLALPLCDCPFRSQQRRRTHTT